MRMEQHDFELLEGRVRSQLKESEQRISIDFAKKQRELKDSCLLIFTFLVGIFLLCSLTFVKLSQHDGCGTNFSNQARHH